MSKIQWLPAGNRPLADGLRLTLLNGVLVLFCSGSFLGTLFAVSRYNSFRQSHGLSPSDEIPFPYPILFGIYISLFGVAWFWFGRLLPSTGRARLLTALVGSGSLLGFSFIGYLGTGGAAIASGMNPEQIPIASVFVLGAISTGSLLAGLASIAMVYASGGRPAAGRTRQV